MLLSRGVPGLTLFSHTAILFFRAGMQLLLRKNDGKRDESEWKRNEEEK